MTAVRLIKLLILCVCIASSLVSCGGYSASQTKEMGQERDRMYRDIVARENSMVEAKKAWAESKRLQIGEDPERALQADFDELNNRWIDLLCPTAPDQKERCRKKQYMNLIRQYGLVSVLLRTGCFSKEELRAIQQKGDVEATVLFNQSMQ